MGGCPTSYCIQDRTLLRAALFTSTKIITTFLLLLLQEFEDELKLLQK
jgi:hypothetical protein